MKYSEQDIIQKKKNIVSKKHRQKMRWHFAATRIILVSMIAIVLMGAFGLTGIYRGLIESAPSIKNLSVQPKGYATVIYDVEGNKIQTLMGSDANRIYAPIDEIAPCVQEAFISIEDERFYQHNGIDVKGIVRAIYSGITDNNGFDQGASTITQQLLKNQVFEGGKENTFLKKVSRKVQEQYLAVQLEQTISKKKILEYYLNSINLGQNTLGVQTAAKRYFNKDVMHLNVSEAAVLAGITQNPTKYNPITNPTNNRKKRKIVLRNMLEQHYITENDYEKALADNVYAEIQKVNQGKKEEKSTTNSYYVDAVIDSVIKDLKQQLGYTETQAYNAIYRGGLKIYSCQEEELQSVCNEVINDPSYYPSDTKSYLSLQISVKQRSGQIVTYSENDLKQFWHKKQKKEISLYFNKESDCKKYIERFKKSIVKKGENIVNETKILIPEPQASFVLMEQGTGKVRAIVGGRGEKTANRTLNRAMMTKRQPGSTFKILSTYLPALDTCGMTLASVEDDVKYCYPGTKREVKNWKGQGHLGLTTLRDAIVQSDNVVAVKTLKKVTPQTGYDYLKRLGISTLVEKRKGTNGKIYSDIGLPLALGGLTQGVTNLELTAAYASIANGGEYREPIFYTKIVDRNGNVLLDKKQKTTCIMKQSTAWLLTNAMQDVVKYGTGKKVAFKNITMPVAGKTGTTTGNTDYWFEGYTPYYTAGIWMGYDHNESQEDTNSHKEMWRAIMEKVHTLKHVKYKKFAKPKGIIERTICTKSGKLAVSGLCDQALSGNCERKEYFAEGTAPKQKCNRHVKYTFNRTTGRLADKNVSAGKFFSRVYLLKKNRAESDDSPYLLPENLMK